jgi:hypothetical protein
VTVADTLAQETALIDAARAEAARSPALALQLLERHGTEFPDGQLAPEREFLAVEALSRLGRHGEATQRAAALKRRAPHSSYAARAERLLEGARRQAWQQ